MSKKLVLGIILAIAAATAAGIMFRPNEQPASAPKIPLVGLLVPSDYVGIILENKLGERGYIENQTIQYHMIATAFPEEYAPAIQSFIDSDVDIIVTSDSQSTLVASQLTTTIPIVFTTNQSNFSTDLAPLIKEQGAKTNLTGVISINPAEKRFQLMMEADPSIKVVYVPYDPSNPVSVETIGLIEALAIDYGVTLEKYEFNDDAGAQQAMKQMPQNMDAIFLGEEVPAILRMALWGDLSIERQAALIVPYGQFTEGLFPPKVLMGYGGGVQELFGQGADLIDQILQGTALVDLPPRPSDVYLSVSLGAAEALHLEIPDNILDQATQVLREPVMQNTPAVADTSAACNATLLSPIGEIKVCITNSCDLVVDSGFANYVEKVPAESCSPEGMLGVCMTDTVDTYFYSGNIAPVEGGCATNGGIWKTPED